MPNIPRLPGVPALSSYTALPFILLIADAIGVPTGFFGRPVWGIYLSGVTAIEVNSVLGFDYKRDWSISDYPVEEGAFQSYDKVELPFDVRVRVASGGSAAERQQLLSELDVLGASLELYDVVTPEKVYLAVNVAHIDYHRTATNGVGMIVADIWFTEIRVTTPAQFTNTKSPVNSGQQNIGSQQPREPTAAQGTYMTDMLSGLRQVGVQ